MNRGQGQRRGIKLGDVDRGNGKLEARTWRSPATKAEGAAAAPDSDHGPNVNFLNVWLSSSLSILIFYGLY